MLVTKQLTVAIDFHSMEKINKKLHLQALSWTAMTRMLLKRQFTQKLKFCNLLITLKLFQTCMGFFLLLNTKEDTLKNVGI